MLCSRDESSEQYLNPRQNVVCGKNILLLCDTSDTARTRCDAVVGGGGLISKLHCARFSTPASQVLPRRWPAEGASFEEVVNAKNGALARAGSDSGMQEQVEKAYDVLLMSSMKARLEGSVDSSVR